MSRWNSKQLVLDASLAAGSKDSMFNPISGLPGDENRKLLEAVWEEEHVAVFNSQLRREWRDHAGVSARAWLQRMDQKERILVNEGSEFSVLQQAACDCQASDRQKAALEKDFHLVQSALATGQVIVSNETRFPRYVAIACASVKQLQVLHYANPTVEGDACRLWIKAGAEKEPSRRIDIWAERPCGSD